MQAQGKVGQQCCSEIECDASRHIMRNNVLSPKKKVNTKTLMHAFGNGAIDAHELEMKMVSQGVEINGHQQKLLDERKHNPELKTSELFLAFADPKQADIGNFSMNQARLAEREPIQHESAHGDIFTGKGADWNKEYASEIMRKKKFPGKNMLMEDITTKPIHKKGTPKSIKNMHESSLGFGGTPAFLVPRQ